MDYEYDEFDDDDEYEGHEEDWIPLGLGVWLILHYGTRGTSVLWATEQPGGGKRIGGLIELGHRSRSCSTSGSAA